MIILFEKNLNVMVKFRGICFFLNNDIDIFGIFNPIIAFKKGIKSIAIILAFKIIRYLYTNVKISKFENPKFKSLAIANVWQDFSTAERKETTRSGKF